MGVVSSWDLHVHRWNGTRTGLEGGVITGEVSIKWLTSEGLGTTLGEQERESSLTMSSRISPLLPWI